MLKLDMANVHVSHLILELNDESIGEPELAELLDRKVRIL